LPSRDQREPLTITVTYMGGNECWFKLQARGRSRMVPGHRALLDVFRDIVG
jgi:hypothetical protein